MTAKRVVHRIEDGMDLNGIAATDYQMRDPCVQFRDAFANHLDSMCYIQHLRAAHLIRPGWRVVDVACGRGLLLRFVRHFSKTIGEYVGVDLSERNLREAQRRACGKTIDHKTFYPFPHRWVNCDAAEMSRHLPSNYFDFAVFTSAIEHTHKRTGQQILCECAKVLKPGALLYLSCPNTSEERDGHDTQYRAHIYEWKLSELRDGLRKEGFSVHREYGLIIGKRELVKAVAKLGPQVRLLVDPILEYLPREFLTTCLAAPFPTLSKEVLILARKDDRR